MHPNHKACYKLPAEEWDKNDYQQHNYYSYIFTYLISLSLPFFLLFL